MKEILNERLSQDSLNLLNQSQRENPLEFVTIRLMPYTTLLADIALCCFLPLLLAAQQTPSLRTRHADGLNVNVHGQHGGHSSWCRAVLVVKQN